MERTEEFDFTISCLRKPDAKVILDYIDYLESNSKAPKITEEQITDIFEKHVWGDGLKHKWIDYLRFETVAKDILLLFNPPVKDIP